MARIFNLSFIVNGRLYIKYGLLFFLLVIFFGCKNSNQQLTLVWKDHRAIALQIPAAAVSDATHLKVVLPNSSKGIFGDFKSADGLITFTPLIPLSPGLSYTILQDEKVVGHVNVPQNTGEPAPQLIAVYPASDTLPENQLKLYLQFSKSMRTGQSLTYVCLLDKNKDTMRNVFLNLQPELWDTTGKVLTLWLDPGRIKRGLVLNRKLGNPLKKSESYQLVISQKWKDTHGLNLSKAFTKQFVVGDRDEQIPDINTWQLNIPKAGTTASLLINTHESLDHYLLQESVSIVGKSGEVINGGIGLNANDQVLTFTPIEPWKAQTYKLHVNARLEDLAGNNLNRVFDRDLTKDKQTNKAFFERGFEVK